MVANLARVPQLAVVTVSVGAVMLRLGLNQGLLQFRKVRRRCPSCGRLIERAICEACTGRTR